MPKKPKPADPRELVADGFATVKEAAAYLRIATSTLYVLMDAGQIKYAKVGHSRRIPWRCLHDYAVSCIVDTDNPTGC